MKTILVAIEWCKVSQIGRFRSDRSLTGRHNVVGAPPLVDGEADDGEGELEAVCEDVDQGGGDEDDVSPAPLGVVVLSECRGLGIETF